MPRQFQNFSVCLSNASAKKKKKKTAEENLVYYVGNDQGL